MSITDELREYSKTTTSFPAVFKELTDIADRIDERYEQSKRNLTDALHQQEEATFKLSEKSVLLPVDADGVPIHIGDEVEFFNGNHDHVRLLALRESGWSVNSLEWDPASLRHHQPDTWERIIQDAIAEGFERTDVSASCVVGNDELVERCKKLAGEAE